MEFQKIYLQTRINLQIAIFHTSITTPLHWTTCLLLPMYLLLSSWL